MSLRWLTPHRLRALSLGRLHTPAQLKKHYSSHRKTRNDLLSRRFRKICAVAKFLQFPLEDVAEFGLLVDAELVLLVIANRAGRKPTCQTEVSPLAIPSFTRPGASRSIAAILDAVTLGWRVTGFTTNVPACTRWVLRTAVSRLMKTSPA